MASAMALLLTSRIASTPPRSSHSRAIFSATSALFYTPNADTTFSGGGELYGAVVTKTLKDTGGAIIHYDRNLANSAMTAGNWMMSGFTWKTY